MINYYPNFGSGTSTTAVANASDSLCVIQGGAVKCYGQNTYGDIGLTAGTSRWSVDGAPNTVIASGATAIAGGGNHFCAVVSGAVKCWGYNGYGQLGDNTTTNRTAPVTPVASGATAVYASDNASCAIVSGAAKCWGMNTYGTLGDGTSADKHVPTQVSGLTSGVTAMAMKFDHACAIVSGAAKCWGLDEDAQVGDATLGVGRTVTTPNNVIGMGSGVTAIAVGNKASCAIQSGVLKCWGSGRGNAALADAHAIWTNTQFSPTNVGSVAKVVLTGPASGTHATCVGPFTITTKNSADVTTNVAGSALALNVVTSGSAVAYTSSGCATSLTTTSISVGTSTATFYLKDPSIEEVGIEVDYGGVFGGVMADGIRHTAN
jgi:alpha-tubulin suppressor-like RCC1 family protein